MNAMLTIRALGIDEADSLSSFLRSQTSEYARFFHPFNFDSDSIRDVLARPNQDVMMGLYWQDRMVGFFMLRGWNEGYDVPAFGILIDEEHRGCGLEMLSLETAKIICKLRGASRLMIKMHPDNISAKGVARKTGFVQSGVEAESGNLIYHFELGSRKSQTG